LLIGRGIVDPPDEMNSKHAPSHPELLDWLAADFAAHQYSVRRLIRSIVLSRGYQLARPAGSHAPPPEAFAAALEKPLTAEAIARSATIASGRNADDNLRQAIAERFPESPSRPARATIQQTMFLANSEQMATMFAPTGNEVAPGTTPADCVRTIFRRALIREPDAEELAHGAEFLTDHENLAAASGQLLWALVAGPEFLTNH
jgi:hypothetical protein